MGKTGVLTVVSGFSGAGKGTVMKALLAKYEYALSTSATTRSPREGEVNGREYFFLSKEEFEAMIEGEELIEWAQYVGNYYGTPKKYVEQQLAEGKNVILEIEVQGALNVKKMFPDALLIFVTPPSAQDLKARLIGRGTESMDTINDRMRRAAEESVHMCQYDYISVNDVLEECVEDINAVIQQASDYKQQGTSFHTEKNFANIIEKMQQELQAINE